ncbi:transposase [Neolewinella sp.]|uniref:transposase n=1 Tax=Neolewinella sp. TaxID=2993543 RepID=UPI003B52586F
MRRKHGGLHGLPGYSLYTGLLRAAGRPLLDTTTTTTTGARIIGRQVQQMKKNLAELNARLTALMQEDERMRRLYRITQSVPGRGPKNSLVVLALTQLYQKISTARACCASYAGISPHTYQSGSQSVRRKPRTSKASSAELKTAIHLGAMSLIKHDNLYRQRYDRLRAKGKAHRSAINAVRNKMLRVLYACIEKDTLYQKDRHVSLHFP